MKISKHTIERCAIVAGACFVGYYGLTKFAPSFAFTQPPGTSFNGKTANSGNFQNKDGTSNYAPVVLNSGQKVDNTAVEVGAAAAVLTTAMSIWGGAGASEDDV